MNDIPKAIFLDIDGTLINRDKGPFVEDIEQMIEAQKQGHHIFLSTGRSLGNIPQTFLNAHYIEGIIAGSGAHILVKGEAVHRERVPEELLLTICDYYLNNSKWCGFEGETSLYGIHQCDRGLLSGNLLVITGKDDFTNKYKGAAVTKLTIEGMVSDDERMMLQGFFKLNQFPDYFEGIIKNESKSHGMEIILEKIGIPQENSIAIGDSVNDIDMINFAGLGIAVGNACEELKQIADKITTDCEHGGVGNAIRQWVLNKRQGIYWFQNPQARRLEGKNPLISPE
jgi:Cof subfamily protein (haloacid dehalogenase superfamily)